MKFSIQDIGMAIHMNDFAVTKIALSRDLVRCINRLGQPDGEIIYLDVLGREPQHGEPLGWLYGRPIIFDSNIYGSAIKFIGANALRVQPVEIPE
jgi:hypothetical protein